jgi:radical SAM protein with 4Fe4S-binding SPASM domain
MSDLYLIAANLTRRCNLACDHCYMDAETRTAGGEAELSSAEVKGLLDEIAGRSNETMVVLTGGEPLLRRDLEEMILHGQQLGLSMVVGTNGVLLDRERVQSLKAAGAMGVGISLDSLDPAGHDRFRGCPGSWKKTLAGMDHCREEQLPFQIHFSVTEQNAHEVQGMIDFAGASGAHVLNIFFLVCTGRGESMSDITPARYEEVLGQLVKAQNETRDLIIRARCAPHYKRVAYQHDPDSPLTRAQGYEGGGCLAGIHYCRITPEGGVTACPYIPDEEGSIRQGGFWEIWDRSENFRQLRHPQLQGKCGHCEFRKLCGGCRARPLALGGGLMDADPWCNHYPSGKALIEPLSETRDQEVSWSPEAEARLARVPGFLRKMVRKRAESHVRELGESIITVEHMQTLAARRFGDNFPGQRPDTAPAQEQEGTDGQLTWTAQAREYLESVPEFLRQGIAQVADDVARAEGRLEVNMKLLERLEAEHDQQRELAWSMGADERLTRHLDERPPQVAMFLRASLEAAAEREARRHHATTVSTDDLESVITTSLSAIEWEPEALRRVESAPDFIRAGIKKAAEFGARREGLERITSADLTRFRNRAMMRAVRRMKGFGMQELNFEGYDLARERVPRLKGNAQAEKRFADIRRHVESKRADDGSGLGVLDRELLGRMKAELKG